MIQQAILSDTVSSMVIALCNLIAVGKPHIAIRRKTMDISRITNAVISIPSSGKVEISFPENGFIKLAKSKFHDLDDLLNYISEILSIQKYSSELRIPMKRVGKYQRVDHQGRSIFTFGDPILDLITDENGLLVIGDEEHNFRSVEQSIPSNQARLTSNHPDRQVFRSNDGGTMEFRAWKKNRLLYWSMGAEIETRGGDFAYAEIQSQYGDTVIPSSPICAIIKIDSDSDSDDDYLEESERGVGAAPQPQGVLSLCQAQWKGERYEAIVEAGGCAGWAEP